MNAVETALDNVRIKYGYVEDWWRKKLTCVPIIAIAVGFTGGNGRGIKVFIGDDGRERLFWNGFLFIRVGLSLLFGLPIGALVYILLTLNLGWSYWYLLLSPFVGLFCFQLRWSGSTTVRSRVQTYIGPKCWLDPENGAEVALFPRFRIQSDVSSAIGTSTPNTDQAQGWEFGPK
jgi:hypothetical protein